jgi:hypothetical protein
MAPQAGLEMIQMKPVSFALAAITTIFAANASAQAAPTATKDIQLSGFAGVTGVQTGLCGGKNLGVTAGFDIGFRPVYSLRPSFEIRGTYPFARGHIDSQKSVLAGLKVGKPFGRLSPYGDALFGRGESIYSKPLADPSGTFGYLRNAANVFSFGGGVDVTLGGPFDFKADGQVQRYASPVTDSGHLWSKQATVGIVYRLMTR